MWYQSFVFRCFQYLPGQILLFICLSLLWMSSPASKQRMSVTPARSGAINTFKVKHRNENGEIRREQVYYLAGKQGERVNIGIIICDFLQVVWRGCYLHLTVVILYIFFVTAWGLLLKRTCSWLFTCSCSCLRSWEVHNLICFLAIFVVCVRDGDYGTILLNNGQALISCRWHTRHLSRFHRPKKTSIQLHHDKRVVTPDGRPCWVVRLTWGWKRCGLLFDALLPTKSTQGRWMFIFALYLCHFFFVMLIRYSLWCIATYSAASIFLPKGFQKSLCSRIIWGMNQTKQIPGESQRYELWFEAKKYMKIYSKCKVCTGMREKTTMPWSTENEKYKTFYCN